MTDRLEFKAALTVAETGEITGIAWPFGSADRVGDMIEKGAFAGAAVPMPMLWAHDQSQVVGVWNEITETPEGLTVKGRLLIEDVERAREVRAMVRAGAATGLSIGFQTKAATPRPRGRTITALALHEISVVAVPAHPGAQITSLKTAETPAPQPHHKETQMEPEVVPAPAPAIDTKAFDALKARLDQIEAKANRPQADAHKPGDVSVERKAFQHFLRSGVERMDPLEAKAMTVSTDASGGFLAPKEISNELIKLLVQYSPIRAYAKVIEIGGPSIVFPRRVNSTGATWVTEIAARTASEPTFEQVTLAAHELATFTDVSNALLEDNAYNLEGELLADYSEAFGKTEGTAFINGTGTNQPKGLLAAGNGIATVNSGQTSTITTNSIIATFHSLPAVHAQNAVWILNRTTLSFLRQLVDATGKYLLLDPLSASAPATLLGRPIVEMPDMPNIAANAYPIIFGDLSGYRIVDRVGLSVLRDPFTQAGVGQTRFHARKRLGADITHPDRIVKLRCAV